MIQIDKCATCHECCNFIPFAGSRMTLEEMNQHFSFTKKLCDVFFRETAGKYLIGKYCKQYNAGKCTLYEGDLFPFACAVYPFVIVSTKAQRYKLMIDRNCPAWREALALVDNVAALIEKYLPERELDLFQESDMKRMGYKLTTVVNNFDIEGFS